eukprot:GFUD01004929.1.p1 GENE.GFUD01004929.1~~GFUD01004929.1.p1  ORF type:complete len:394 (+),score=63.11 GFUD01004929.1:125-1306(+)
MLKIMQENVGLVEHIEEETRGYDEGCKMVSDVILDMSEAEKVLWKEVFEKLLVIDNNDSGNIDIEKLIQVVISLNESTLSYWWTGGIQLDRDQLKKLLSQADFNDDGQISICEFYKLWAKDCSDISREMKDYIAKSLKTVAFAKNIKKCPPPLFIPLLSILQIILFTNNNYEVSDMEHHDPHDPNTTYSHLIFEGNSRYEVWRYLTYSLVHKQIGHLLMVLLVQLVLGILMEMVHGSIRIGLIYLSGVLAGSLASFILHPQINLLGGSGGCYGLIGAHCATLLINWHEDHAIVFSRVRSHKTPTIWHGKLIRSLKLLGLLVFIVGDVIVAMNGYGSDISYVAHICGFISGFVVGFIITRDRFQENWEKILKIIFAVISVILLFVGVLWNIFGF